MTVMSVNRQSGPVSNTASSTSLKEPSNLPRIVPSTSQQTVSKSPSTSELSYSSNFVQDKSSTAPNIPQLSSATRELIAKVNSAGIGSVTAEVGFSSFSSFNGHRSPTTSRLNETNGPSVSSNMRLTSAILELPSAPFPKNGSPKNESAQNVALLQSQQQNLQAIPPSYDFLQTSAVTTTTTPPTLASKTMTGVPIQPQSPLNQEPKKGTPRHRKSSTGAKKGKRRKRNRASDDEHIRVDDSSSDESEDMAPVATQTKSGRQIHRPTLFAPPSLPVSVTKSKGTPNGASAENASNVSVVKRRKVYRKGKEQNVTCKHCQRGYSPSTNTIVFCDGCNRAWHQFCHDPPIEKAVIEVKEAEWYCSGCRPPDRSLNAPPRVTQPASGFSFAEVPRIISQANIETTSHGPIMNPNGKVGGKIFTTSERLGYLAALSHSELVNLLLNITDQNPDLPIFPSNMRELPPSQFDVSPNGVLSVGPLEVNKGVDSLTDRSAGLNTTVIRQHTAVSEEAVEVTSRKKRKGKGDDSDDSGSEYEIEEHRLYPRSGNGFRLPPESEDIGILLDDPACPTFSYSLHRRLGIASNPGRLISA